MSTLGARTDPVHEPDEAPRVDPPAAGAAPASRAWAAPLARNLAWNTVSEFAARGASLWLAFACARVLPVSAFGRFSFALAIAQWAWLAGDASANSSYATREVARVRAFDPGTARRIKGRILAMRLLAAAAVTVGFVLTALIAPMPADMRGAVLGASVFFVSFAAFPDWALRAREDFRTLAFANLASAAALVAGTLLWLPRHPDAGLAAALWGGSFAVAAAVALGRLLSARAFEWRDGGSVGGHARRSVVFSLGAIAGIGCAQAPLVIVGLMAPAYEGGLFSAGYRFLLVVINVFSVLWWPLMPVLVRSRPGEDDFRDALATMGGVVLLLGLPAALVFALWPADLLTLAFGARYAGGATALCIAGAAVPFFALTALLEQTSLALGGEVVRAALNAVALAVLVVLCVLLVPGHGPAGAAGATLAAYVVSASGYAIAFRSRLPWRAMAANARLPLLLNAGLALVWLAARALHAPMLPAVAAASAAYGLAALATGALGRRGVAA